MSAGARRRVLGGALALALSLSAWFELADRDGESPPAAASLVPPAAPEQAAAAPGWRLRRRPPSPPPPGQDLFPAQSWAPPPALVALRTPPQAPALPFVYGGSLLEDKKVTVYLSADQRNLVVHPGEVIDGAWLLKSVAPDSLTFVYLPLRQEQYLPIGSSN